MATISEALAIAVQHHQAGRFQAAEQIYRQILALQPDQADALHLLGVLAYQAGQHATAVQYITRAIAAHGTEAAFHVNLGNALGGLGKRNEAIAAFRRAISLKPDSVDAHNNLGIAYHEQGKLGEAIACYRRALERKPDYADAHNNLGKALKELGDLDEAAASFRQVLQFRPADAGAHVSLGNVLRDQGKPDEAIACYRRALEIEPQAVEVYNNLGNALSQLARPGEAIACYRRALELQPDFPEALNNLGNVLNHQGRPDEAIACYRRALTLEPDYPDALNNLGVVLKGQRVLDEAVACYRQALKLKPDFAQAQNNLGIALHEQGKLDEALACYRRTLELQPDFAEAHNNLGNALKDLGRLDEAVACYSRAAELLAASTVSGKSQDSPVQQEYAEVRAHRAFAWLLAGDWQRGWPEYDWRWKARQLPPRHSSQPLWDGRPLEGKAILLHAEQGLGDAVQFVRYAPLVKRLAGTVILQCPKVLLPLMATCPGVDQLVGEEDRPPPFAAQAPLLSLPGILRTSPQTVPADVPYLSANPALAALWRQKLRSIGGYKIGIHWQGRPAPGPWNARDIPLQQFAILAEIPGVRLISLQRGPGREQLAQARLTFDLLDLGDDVDRQSGAFMDTAAVMKNLDLIITSDTAVAHLAGALATPVWVALSLAPDWRWFLTRTDSPWYPTMRLFRQKEWGNWRAVFGEITAALSQRLKSPRGDHAG
jgi:tetratricopeptide (TPR) repeat protein